jgi:hypothetical protein
MLTKWLFWQANKRDLYKQQQVSFEEMRLWVEVCRSPAVHEWMNGPSSIATVILWKPDIPLPCFFGP